MHPLFFITQSLRLIAIFLLLGIQVIQAETQKTKAPIRVTADIDNADMRLKKIERILQNQGLLDMLQRIERLQEEKNRLQGELDIQRNDLESLKEKQRGLYQDIDQRLQLLEEKNITKGVQKKIDTPSVATDIVRDQPQKEYINLKKKISEPGDTASITQQKDDEKIQIEYQQTFQLLRQAQYTKAKQGFTQFLSTYPDSEYADNAQYWLAETYYVTQDYQKALNEYEKLLSNYPESAKKTHTLLKIAYSYHELGNTNEAKKRLTELIKKYPNTTVAHLAADRLQQINRAQ